MSDLNGVYVATNIEERIELLTQEPITHYDKKYYKVKNHIPDNLLEGEELLVIKNGDYTQATYVTRNTLGTSQHKIVLGFQLEDIPITYKVYTRSQIATAYTHLDIQTTTRISMEEKAFLLNKKLTTYPYTKADITVEAEMYNLHFTKEDYARREALSTLLSLYPELTESKEALNKLTPKLTKLHGIGKTGTHYFEIRQDILKAPYTCLLDQISKDRHSYILDSTIYTALLREYHLANL